MAVIDSHFYVSASSLIIAWGDIHKLSEVAVKRTQRIKTAVVSNLEYGFSGVISQTVTGFVYPISVDVVGKGYSDTPLKIFRKINVVVGRVFRKVCKRAVFGVVGFNKSEYF